MKLSTELERAQRFTGVPRGNLHNLHHILMGKANVLMNAMLHAISAEIQPQILLSQNLSIVEVHHRTMREEATQLPVRGDHREKFLFRLRKSL